MEVAPLSDRVSTHPASGHGDPAVVAIVAQGEGDAATAACLLRHIDQCSLCAEALSRAYEVAVRARSAEPGAARVVNDGCGADPCAGDGVAALGQVLALPCDAPAAIVLLDWSRREQALEALRREGIGCRLWGIRMGPAGVLELEEMEVPAC